jgi:DNA-binding MarR family transcriptional regulator
LLLLAGFRSVIDEVHAELAAQGHPGMRPAHGFALQAIGTFGATAVEVGRRLGVSKQAAGKTIDRLAELGYVTRAEASGPGTHGPGTHGADGNGVSRAGSDRRRKLVRLTDRGTEALALSAEAFGRVRGRWAAQLGQDRVTALEADLRAVTPGQPLRLDLPGWLSS